MEENPYEAPKLPTEPIVPAKRSRYPAAIVAAQVATGFVAGFSIWAAVAPKEAWDVNPLYYNGSVFAAGLLSSFARPRGFYWGIIGVYLGQVIAIRLLVPLETAVIMLPFIGVLIFGTPPAAVGALIGAGIGFCIQNARPNAKPK
jgi:hypothetical protein